MRNAYRKLNSATVHKLYGDPYARARRAALTFWLPLFLLGLVAAYLLCR